MLFCSYAIWENTALQISRYSLTFANLPESFDGYRIVHISDLHNAETSKDNKKLIDYIKQCKPDIICITGDIIDSRRTDIAVALNFVGEIVEIAPCYYVTGNHEQRVRQYPELKKGLENIGAIVLDDEFAYINQKDSTIKIIGINDPSFETTFPENNVSVIGRKLAELKTEKDTFTLLLSHRPELFDVYASNKIDLVLTGHAHGGQFRIGGGLFAPNQGFFPEYDAGVFYKDGTNMVVSRGIGNSIIPIRINNRPEIVFIELKNKG